MFESFVSAGALALLLFTLGAYVSLQRTRAGKRQAAEEADPASPLRKAIRAHGNCAEYAPTLALLCLALGARDPAFGVEMTMYAAVLARVLHAAGALVTSSVHGFHPLRFIGSIGTYASGAALAVALLLEAPEVW